MIQGYLYLNSILYLLLAFWSTVASQSMSTRLGYITMSNRGHSEYLVIYGGLQVGLAILFFLLAQNRDFHRLGLLISIGFYAPIVIYRLVIILVKWPDSGFTTSTIVLEAFFLLAALWLYFSKVS